MALNQSRQRSQLGEIAETKRLLHKIAALLAQSPRHLVFEIAGQRYRASDLGSVTLDETLVSGNITFKRAPLASVKASKVIQDLTYQADTAGAAGNSITITYVNDGTAGAETVGVVGSAITVHMQSGASTATQIKAAVDASGAAAALVDVSISGVGATAQTAVGATSLAGGVTASSLETYDTADILMVKRLRTKKYLIIIKDAANPA